MNQEKPTAKGEPRDRDMAREPMGGSTGMTAKGSAVPVDVTVEDAYWREHYADASYIEQGYTYDDYGPAYRYGVDAYGTRRGRAFDDVESELSTGWERAKSGSRLTWERAKHAVRDAWNRASNAIERAIPGDSDRDGR